jgi:hypothetical protein
MMDYYSDKGYYKTNKFLSDYQYMQDQFTIYEIGNKPGIREYARKLMEADREKTKKENSDPFMDYLNNGAGEGIEWHSPFPFKCRISDSGKDIIYGVRIPEIAEYIDRGVIKGKYKLTRYKLLKDWNQLPLDKILGDTVGDKPDILVKKFLLDASHLLTMHAQQILYILKDKLDLHFNETCTAYISHRGGPNTYSFNKDLTSESNHYCVGELIDNYFCIVFSHVGNSTIQEALGLKDKEGDIPIMPNPDRCFFPSSTAQAIRRKRAENKEREESYYTKSISKRNIDI